MAASYALPTPSGLTERRNEISTVDASVLPAELAPEIQSAIRGRLIVNVEKDRTVRGLEFIIPLPPPSWLFPSVEHFAPLLFLQKGWDRAGAEAVEVSSVQSALDALWGFMSTRSSAPQWTPTRLGGVQLDWHEKGVDLEIVFEPHDLDGQVVFSDNTGTEWDGPVSAHWNILRSLFEDRLVSEL